MVPGFLVILFITPVFCFTSSILHFTGDNFDDVLTKNLPSTIRVKIPSKEKEINIAKYYNSTELKELLDRMSEVFGNIMSVSNIGDDDKKIWAVQITRDVNHPKDPKYPRELMKPRFRFVANIHGDDALEYALMVTLIQYLVYHYEVDNRITTLINTIDIWIVPTLSPDGLRKSEIGRCESLGTGIYDEQGEMLPDETDYDLPASVRLNDLPNSQNIMGSTSKDPFTLSGVLMGGAIVASYPLRQSEDNEIFVKLAKEYAEQNPMMTHGDSCNKSFPGGIVGGSPWPKRGELKRYEFQDKSNCVEITLFLGCCKSPEPRFLPYYWHANKEAMLQFIGSTRRGVYGIVKDEEGDIVQDVVITVAGQKKEVTVNRWSGEYWILLVPGTYDVTARFDAVYKTKTITVNVEDDEPFVHQDFVLEIRPITGAIHGRVTDENGKTIEGAVLNIEGEETVIKTNPNGTYHLALFLDKKKTNVTASAPGYVKKIYMVKRQNIKEPNDLLKFDFSLVAQGFTCMISDTEDKPLKNAVIRITGGDNIDKEIKLEKYQDVIAFRPLALGGYNLTVSCPNYKDDGGFYELTEERPFLRISFTLEPISNNSANIFGKLWGS